MAFSPAVSVVVPTYNRADLLSEALDSILAQDWSPLEIVVVDDGSTDDTPRILERFTRAHEGIFRVIRQPNAGEAHARSEGIRAARHPFVALLDSDNVWLPGKLRRQMQLFEGDPSLDFTFTGYYNFGDRPREEVLLPRWETSTEFALEQLFISCCINISSVVARRSTLMDAGLFDPALRLCVDYDCWLRVAAAGYRIGYLAEPLLDYRIHGGCVSLNLLQVNLAAERVLQGLFASKTLPPAFQGRWRFYLARCYLSTACRYFEVCEWPAVRQSLWRAARTRPLSVRPGWILMYLRSLFRRARPTPT
jgi:glycosyltransferase involved in cell wall biosynthesis